MKNTIGQSRTWVYSTVAAMSFNGGYINIICLSSILKNAVGYVTGNLTIAGQALALGHFLLFAHLVLLVLAFLLGSILSGLIVKGQALALGKRYNLTLLVQLALVLMAMVLLLYHQTVASYCLAMTMGLQNAMTTHYGSALIRTTHMTGTTTDLGLLISQYLKGQPVETWKMRLYLYLILGFALGAIVGALSYNFFHAWALSLSLALYLLMLNLRRQN